VNVLPVFDSGMHIFYLLLHKDDLLLCYFDCNTNTPLQLSDGGVI
jgi:hypothetical protein